MAFICSVLFPYEVTLRCISLNSNIPGALFCVSQALFTCIIKAENRNVNPYFTDAETETV